MISTVRRTSASGNGRLPSMNLERRACAMPRRSANAFLPPTISQAASRSLSVVAVIRGEPCFRSVTHETSTGRFWISSARVFGLLPTSRRQRWPTLPPAPPTSGAPFTSCTRPGCFVIPNPWDIGSARYLQSLGFKALATTSSGFAWSRGRPDGGISRDAGARLLSRHRRRDRSAGECRLRERLR